jgi:hypothetical protein
MASQQNQYSVGNKSSNELTRQKLTGHQSGRTLDAVRSPDEKPWLECGDGTLLHSKSQYTTVKHSRQLLEHTYTSDPHGLGTLTPIDFFQQDLLWQSSNTRSHSCSHKASKHKLGQSIDGLSVLLHTTTALRRIFHH